MRICAVARCPREGVHALGVRCRRADTSALWAPNADAGLCDVHARQGLVVSIVVVPRHGLGGVAVDVAGTYRLVPFSEAVEA